MNCNSLQAAGEGLPVDIKFVPTLFVEGAGEYHMLDRFLDVQPAEEVVVITSYVLVPYFEHITSV